MLNVLKACLGLAVLAVAFLPANVRAADENPFKKAVVGDWVGYKNTTKMQGADMASEMKQTVTAKTEKTITLKIEVIMNGAAVSTTETVIELDKPYDPTATTPNSKVEKLGEGEESITVGGKTYATKWVKMKITMDNAGTKMESESKAWTSPDVPLGGLVKSETVIKSMNMTTVMEMTGAGKK